MLDDGRRSRKKRRSSTREVPSHALCMALTGRSALADPLTIPRRLARRPGALTVLPSHSWPVLFFTCPLLFARLPVSPGPARRRPAPPPCTVPHWCPSLTSRAPLRAPIGREGVGPPLEERDPGRSGGHAVASTTSTANALVDVPRVNTPSCSRSRVVPFFTGSYRALITVSSLRLFTRMSPLRR